MNINNKNIIGYYILMIMIMFLSVVVYYYYSNEVIEKKMIIAVVKFDNNQINLLLKEDNLLSFIKKEPYTRILHGSDDDKALVDKAIKKLSKYKLVSKTNSLVSGYPLDHIEFRFPSNDSKLEILRGIKKVVEIYNNIYITSISNQYINILNINNEYLGSPIKTSPIDFSSVKVLTLQVSDKLEKIPVINTRSQVIILVLSILILIPFIVKIYSAFMIRNDK